MTIFFSIFGLIKTHIHRSMEHFGWPLCHTHTPAPPDIMPFELMYISKSNYIRIFQIDAFSTLSLTFHPFCCYTRKKNTPNHFKFTDCGECVTKVILNNSDDDSEYEREREREKWIISLTSVNVLFMPIEKLINVIY